MSQMKDALLVLQELEDSEKPGHDFLEVLEQLLKAFQYLQDQGLIDEHLVITDKGKQTLAELRQPASGV